MTSRSVAGSFSFQVRSRKRPAGTPRSGSAPSPSTTANQGVGATKIVPFIDSWIEQ